MTLLFPCGPVHLDLTRSPLPPPPAIPSELAHVAALASLEQPVRTSPPATSKSQQMATVAPRGRS
jgi:hypothetical protein